MITFRKTLAIWWNLECHKNKGPVLVWKETDWKRSSPVLVTISKDDKYNLFINQIFRASFNFFWCPVFKAASTNWMINLVSLANLTGREKLKLENRFKRWLALPPCTKNQSTLLTFQFRQPNVQARVVAPKISPATLAAIERDPSAIRMLTVRHPFNRWASGWVEDHGSWVLCVCT